VVHARVSDGLTGASWPSFDPEVAKAEEITVPVQVNGKVRGRLTVPALDVGVRARSAGPVRSGREGAYCREDGAEGRRGERPPRLNRRSMKWPRDMRAALCSRWRW
jgi:hypothetical protein